METFATSDIEHAVGESSYLRGMEYFRRGMVNSVKFGDPARSAAWFRAAGPNPMRWWPDTKPAAATSWCRSGGTVPARSAHNCKHTAAVLLAARGLSPEARHIADGSADESMSRDVRGWLDDWPGWAPARPDAGPPGPPEPGRDHLFYVVHRDETGGMRIDPWRAYLKNDGEIGRNVREYREGTASAEGRFATAQDASLLGRLGHYRRGIWPLRYDWPEGDELVALVRGIVETGRALADDIRGMALSWAAPRRCELSWEVDGAGRQRVAAHDDAGARLTLLPFPTPLFLDPNTGRSASPKPTCRHVLASWFAAAPPVERGSIDGVVAKLSRIGRHAPVPKPHRVEERNDIRPEPVLKLFGREHRRMRYAHDGRRLVSVGLGDAVLYPCARLEVVYPGAGGRLRAGQGDDIAVKDGNRYAIVRRDRARETEFLETLREAARPHAWSEGEHMRYGLGGQDEVPDADIVFPPPGVGKTIPVGPGRASPPGRYRGCGPRAGVSRPTGHGRSGCTRGRSGSRPGWKTRGTTVLAPPLAGGGRKEVRRGADRAAAGRTASRRRSGPAGGGLRRRAPSGPAEASRSGWTTAAGSCWMRCGSRHLPRPFWKPRGYRSFTAPMRAGCPRWPRRWREAARPGPAGGSSSIWAPGCGRWPRRRKRSRPPR